MSNKIFREIALERLSSPEQLDQMSAVVGFKSWLVLAVCGCLIFALSVWVFTATVVLKATGYGVINDNSVSTLRTSLFVPPADAAKLLPGMEVHITGLSQEKGDTGFIPGSVVSVNPSPLSLSGLTQATGNEPAAKSLLSGGYTCQVQVVLTPEKKDALDSIKPGALYLYTGTVFIKKFRPIDFIMPQNH